MGTDAIRVHSACQRPNDVLHVRTCLYRKPDWLVGERGPDVSPYLRWLPMVTFLQAGFDIPMATSVPLGYGHNFAPASYIDAWIEVTQPESWTAADTKRLKQLFAEQ